MGEKEQALVFGSVARMISIFAKMQSSIGEDSLLEGTISNTPCKFDLPLERIQRTVRHLYVELSFKFGSSHGAEC